MPANISFISYSPGHKAACLALFDANCPEYFSPGERTDYESFLEANNPDYELCFIRGRVAGAFGLMGDDPNQRSLNWILLGPTSQGQGIGAAIMERIILKAKTAKVDIISIDASHKSAPFFEKFGAIETDRTENGWGPGLHRVDMTLQV